MKKLLIPFLFAITFLPQAVSAQKLKRDNSFKILATMTGLGASYEWNPAGIVYTETGMTTSFNAFRFNVQSKLALYRDDNFKVKFGVEGAFIVGNFDVGGIYIDYDRYNNFVFMPVISFETKVVGIQLPVFVDRAFQHAFPIVGITLNVSKDKPANRVKKDKSAKDFEKERREREKYMKKHGDGQDDN